MRILSYHVYNARAESWLADDEKSWTSRFSEAASFNDWALEAAIGEREKPRADDAVHVLGALA